MKTTALSRCAPGRAPVTKQGYDSPIGLRARQAPLIRQPLFRALALLASLAAITISAHAEGYLPAIGGGGGGQFKAPCAPGQLLAGFELRVGDDVDAIRPLCVLPTEPGKTSAAQASTERWYGGAGGDMQRLLCPAKTPVVIGIDVKSEGVTEVVNDIHLFCGQVVAEQTVDAYPSAILDAPEYTGAAGVMGQFSSRNHGSLRCPANQIATGIHGRSGKWLDAMGLICDAPTLPKAPIALGRVPTEKPVLALGRVKPHKGPALEGAVAIAPVPAMSGTALEPAGIPHPPVADPPICINARQARARNSPAAPGLESQCRAAGGTP